MKILFLILCSSAFLSLQAHAQATNVVKAGTTTSAKIAKTLERAITGQSGHALSSRSAAIVLEKRAPQSTAQALRSSIKLNQAGVHMPGSPNPIIVEKINIGGEAVITETALNHPEAGDIFSSRRVGEENTANYLQAANNRLYTRLAQSILERKPRVPAIMQQVKNAAIPFPVSNHPMAWLAQQVPSDTRILFIGEGFYHNPSVVDGTSDFLKELRKQLPNKEIVLLSGKLKQRVMWSPTLNTEAIKNYRKGYTPLWQTAHQNGIQVIGIEHGNIAAQNLLYMEGSDQTGAYSQLLSQYSYESIDAAAKHMQKDLEEYQYLYPDALIVVHVPQMYASYNIPFSLVSKVQRTGAKVYTTSITSKTMLQSYNPFPGEEAEPLSTRTTMFEQMYPDAHLPDAGAVSRNVAKDVGHDSWVKVTFNSKKTDNGIY